MAVATATWFRSLLAVVVPLSLAGCASQPTPGGAPAEVPMGAHGAASMEYQAAQLDVLLPDAGKTTPPARLDPVVWASYVPEGNETTPARVALGRKLFFDTRLSKDGSVSCATCHDVTRGFTDRRRTSEGIGDQVGRRNAPTAMNAMLLQTLFWDGRVPTLDHQARQPIINPIEMGFESGEAAARAIAGDPEYVRMFAAAYGRAVNYEDIGLALGAFERTLVFLDSPFRRYLLGQEDAIASDAKAGWVLYNERARCAACHPMSVTNPFGSDNRFHNIGVSARQQNFETLAAQALQALRTDPTEAQLQNLAMQTDMSELGRFMVTRHRTDVGAFRTPTVLNVGVTAPYMHDGSLPTLWDVMDHYNKGGEANLYLDGGIEPLALTEAEIDQVVAFLFSLTDDRFAGDNAVQMAAQRTAAQANREFRNDDLAHRRVFASEARIR